MGAWGAGNFENDDALDFLAEVDGPSALEATFAQLPPPGDGEIEAPEACRAMAAAEIVAAMMGRPGADCPAELTARLEDFGDATKDLVALARASVSRVLMDSELLDLWAESENRDDWNRTVTGLIERLNPATPAPPGGSKAAATETADSQAICPYCNAQIGPEKPLMLSVTLVEDDGINSLDRSIFCHLKCFNGALHPRHLIQHWTVDPGDPAFQALVDRILRNDQD